MIQGVIFDMDGLMFDTERIWATLWEPALAGLGLSYKEGLDEAARGTAGDSMRAVLAYLGRATMPIVILHFLSFKLVTWLGLLATGGEPYLLAAFPIYFTGGAWWLAYTAAGLVLPLAANAVYKKIKNTVLAH